MTATTTDEPQAEPFRFFDNRQKYLAFVNTCNEKAVVGARALDFGASVGMSLPGGAVSRRLGGCRLLDLLDLAAAF